MQTLHILTYNIHKGFSQFNKKRISLHELRDRLQSVEPDLVFLQECVGFHARLAERHANWPTAPAGPKIRAPDAADAAAGEAVDPDLQSSHPAATARRGPGPTQRRNRR